MTDDLTARFSAGAKAWANYNQEPLGQIRHEVIWHHLVPHLPEVADERDPPRVLDAGGGSGELALRLSQLGYRVWLLDNAPAMLDQAKEAARHLPEEVRARLTFRLLCADEVDDAFPSGFFDAIACHTLIEYLSEPRQTLRKLSGLLREGGLLSLSFVNRHAEVLREIWSRGDPAAALSKLEHAGFCATLFDVPGRAYAVEEVNGWLSGLGFTPIGAFGVRAFADYVPRERLEEPEFLDSLRRLELAAADTSPYRRIARYAHILAHKNPEPHSHPGSSKGLV
jgi:S-adenosylmethionine-dependent methyltransferase